jgi:hypothetical protein
MYYDKPGYYYDAHEHPLAEAFAASAGFPVTEHAKDRYKREKMAEFSLQVEASLAEAEASSHKEVIAEKGDYRVLAMPYGQAIVVDDADNRLTAVPVPLQAAMGLLDALVPSEPEDIKAKKAAVKAVATSKA